MVKRRIIIILFFVLLITGAILEQLYIKDSIKGLQTKIDQLEQEIVIDYQSTQSFNKVKEIEEFWNNREKVLSVFINYKELKEIVVQIARLEETMQQADHENTFIELTVLKNLTSSTEKVIGFNFQNVI